MMGKKGLNRRGNLSIRVVVESILVLVVVIGIIYLGARIKNIARGFDYQTSQNEKLANQESAYLPFMKGSVKSAMLRSWINEVVDGFQYRISIDCTDASCSELNATFQYKKDKKFEDLECGNKKYVMFNNNGLACCGNYLCILANVDKDSYKVSMTPYSIRSLNKAFVVGVGTGFVLRLDKNYMVNLIDDARPFVRESWNNGKHYNFLIMDDSGRVTYCSGKRSFILKKSGFLCSNNLPFKFIFLENLENGCRIKVVKGQCKVGKLVKK